MKSETLSLKIIIRELNLKKTVIIQWNSWKKDLLLPTDKLIENISDPCNSKEHDQSFIRKKDTKSVKQSKTITYQPKTFENTIIFYIKSVITEHPKASRKLPKNEKVGSNSSLYSDTKKVKIF